MASQEASTMTILIALGSGEMGGGGGGCKLNSFKITLLLNDC